MYRALFKTVVSNKTLDEILAATKKAWVLGSEHFIEQINTQINRQALPINRGGDRKSDPIEILRIIKKWLVKIPYAIEQQGVRMVSLDAQILLHHRCVRAASSLFFLFAVAELIGAMSTRFASAMASCHI